MDHTVPPAGLPTPQPSPTAAPPARVLSLVVLVAAALAPGVVAIAQGAPVITLAAVLPLLVALVVLAQDHDTRVHDAARRLVAAERDRERLADSVRAVGRAFGALDLAGLADLMASTAADALGASRSLVRVAGHSARGGPRDARADALLDEAVARAADGHRAAMTAAGEDRLVALAHPLRDGAGVLAVARAGEPFTAEDRSLLAWLAGQTATSVANVALHQRLHAEAHVDGLTGLANRRTLDETLARELALSRRTQDPVGLVIIDVDDFKQVNDTHGHPVGDRVLVEIADALRAAVRTTDTVARWGGEEFAVVLPHTDLRGAAVAGETVRGALAGVRVPLVGGGELRLTASVGVAAAPETAADPTGLLAAADAALYRAKEQGKDRTCVARAGVAR